MEMPPNTGYILRNSVLGYKSFRRYPYFDIVVGLVWSYDPKSYAMVGPPMPDRSRVITQTKRDTLVLQVGGLAWG
jgi:hypothetical protein